ncbi:MAG: DUF1294 domain-containing protein [Candidatus Methanoplasma sp.]|jgi:uncharacterized membrane protein YsdA (DUF1294 family)|nr:DUF1294 domain-containing protein [Candidatus Methanoplasma sp.]
MNLGLIGFIAIIFIIVNTVSLLLFWADKRRAVKDRYRIKESTLIVSGLIGPFGALAGMKLFRHKTQKRKFKAVYLFLVLHLILIVLLIWKFLI